MLLCAIISNPELLYSCLRGWFYFNILTCYCNTKWINFAAYKLAEKRNDNTWFLCFVKKLLYFVGVESESLRKVNNRKLSIKFALFLKESTLVLVIQCSWQQKLYWQCIKSRINYISTLPQDKTLRKKHVSSYFCSNILVWGEGKQYLHLSLSF